MTTEEQPASSAQQRPGLARPAVGAAPPTSAPRPAQATAAKPAPRPQNAPQDATAASASAVLLGLLMEEAKFGPEALADIRDAIDELTPEMFDEPDQPIFRAVEALVESGRVPAPAHVIKHANDVSRDRLRHCLVAAQGAGELAGGRADLLRAHGLRQVQAAAAAALEQITRGDLTGALAVLGTVDLDGFGDSGAQHLRTLADYDPARKRDPRPITLPWPKVNAACGGGLDAGGAMTMSLWLAPSGVGKTTLMCQLTPYWAKQRHWVLYFSGEADEYYVFDEMCRLDAGVRREAVEAGVSTQIAKLARSRDALMKFGPEAIRVYAKGFTGKDIRRLAKQQAARLARQRDAGLAPAHARLIVVIDNYDNIFEAVDVGADVKEHTLSARESQRFNRHAMTHGYHLAVLHQTNDEGERKWGPAAAGDSAGNRKLHSKFSHVFSIYRPIRVPKDKMTDANGNLLPHAHPQLAVPKHRGGGDGQPIVMDTSPFGTWREGAESDPF